MNNAYQREYFPNFHHATVRKDIFKSRLLTFHFTFSTPEIKQASSASLHILRLRRELFDETEASESNAIS